MNSTVKKISVFPSYFKCPYKIFPGKFSERALHLKDSLGIFIMYKKNGKILEMALISFSWKKVEYSGFKNWLVYCGLELCLIAGVFTVSAIFTSSADFPLIANSYLCPFKRVTGYSCPGCGLTRAFLAAAHGHFLTALQYNAMELIFFPFLLYRFFQRICETLFHKYPQIKVPFFLFFILASVILSFGVIRIILQLLGKVRIV